MPKGSLEPAEIEAAREVSLWAVWYEDRFQVGAARDPAVVVSLHATAEEARAGAARRGPEPSPETGRFDGFWAAATGSLWELWQLGEIDARTVRSWLDRDGSEGS